MEQSKTLFCSSEFPYKIISSKFIENLGTPSKKVSPEYKLKLQYIYIYIYIATLDYIYIYIYM